MGPPLTEVLVRLDERRHRRAEADAVDRVEVEQPGEEDAELVARAVPLGGDTPVLAELTVLEQPEDGLRVAGVYCKEHRLGTDASGVALAVRCRRGQCF